MKVITFMKSKYLIAIIAIIIIICAAAFVMSSSNNSGISSRRSPILIIIYELSRCLINFSFTSFFNRSSIIIILLSTNKAMTRERGGQ